MSSRILVLLLVASTAHADGFVVIRSDAPLYQQPAADGAKASLDPPGTRGLAHVVFHVLGVRPDFVEVESNADDKAHCYQTSAALSAVALHAFVRRSDLAPVITRATTIPLADGTSATLGSGLAATPAAKEMRRVSGEDWSLVLAVPPAAVGVVYEPHVLPNPPATKEVTTPGRFRIAGQPLFELGYPLPAYDVARRASDVLATIVVGCAQFRLALARDRVRAPDDSVLGGLVPPAQPGLTVRAGAPVYWPDGVRAGAMRTDFTFPPSRVVAPHRRCGQIASLPICFDEADVRSATRR
jgi:hypothetical protein